MNLETMIQIMREKAREIEQAGLMPLDAEGRAVAERSRKSVDLPTNAVKVDPMR